MAGAAFTTQDVAMGSLTDEQIARGAASQCRSGLAPVTFIDTLGQSSSGSVRTWKLYPPKWSRS